MTNVDFQRHLAMQERCECRYTVIGEVWMLEMQMLVSYIVTVIVIVLVLMREQGQFPFIKK